MFVITIIVEPPRLFPQTLPQLLDLDHKLVEFPLRRRQRPVRPRHQKETGIRPSGSFAGLEQRSLCLRHSCLLVISDTTLSMHSSSAYPFAFRSGDLTF